MPKMKKTQEQSSNGSTQDSFLSLQGSFETATVNELIDSHDELVKICQALFALMLNKKMDFKNYLDSYLLKNDIHPGFANRAEEVRRKIMRQRIKMQ